MVLFATPEATATASIVTALLLSPGAPETPQGACCAPKPDLAADAAHGGLSEEIVLTGVANLDLSAASTDLLALLQRRPAWTAVDLLDLTPSLTVRGRGPLVREHRLYQSDWLMRYYGFAASEILDKNENLDLNRDPKLSWALKHREFFPVDVNKATAHELLRVPGLGARNVSRILKIRRHHQIRLEDLAKLRVILSRAKWFITTADFNPNVFSLDAKTLEDKLKPKTQQLSLFANYDDAAISALTGQL